MSDLTYYQKNRDVILNRSRDYHENNKERLRKCSFIIRIIIKIAIRLITITFF